VQKNLDLGRYGERAACAFLKKQGYKILDFNFRSKRWGELDIVALDGEVLVFVEVKCRTSLRYGSPAEALNFFKLRSLKRTMQYYALSHPHLPSSRRLDLVTILLDPSILSVLKLEHFRNLTL
jgi:putative endonuclease